MIEKFAIWGFYGDSDPIKKMKEKPTRGGAREGAGRPKGSGTGRTVTTSSINLPPTLWDKLDKMRGEKSRSAWIAEKINRARK